MKDKEKCYAYQQCILKNIDSVENEITTDEKWKKMTELCKKSAKENFETKKSNQRSTILILNNYPIYKKILNKKENQQQT